MRTPLIHFADIPERKLQRTHRACEEAMCLAFARVANSCIESPLEILPPKLQAVRVAYDESVTALAHYLGPDAPCSRVDTYLWRYFVDWYKFVHKMRPSEALTRGAVQSWIAQQEKG